MKKTLILLIIFTGLASCNRNKHFHVSGTVKDAAGEMLYIEHTGLQKTDILDSTKLSADGEFSFNSARPTYPDFYSLRLKDKVITFAVDSCEEINIAANVDNFATNYIITGSETSVQIQQLRKSVMNIQRKANALNSDMSVDEQNGRISEIEKDIEVHKKMAGTMILHNPRSAVAYFAIFQKINNSYIFSPYNKSDKPYCAAVATSYYTFMPEYERSKNLYNLVMDAILTERKANQKESWDKILETKGKGYIEITLPDKNKVERKLSQFEGKVILIDFSAYESDQSVDYTFALRELYNKYHSRGFDIFQISLDRNKQFWEKSVANIPWICVRDENGPNTTVIASYNITSVPTTFLMNKQGNIIARSLSFKDLSKEIEKCL